MLTMLFYYLLWGQVVVPQQTVCKSLEVAKEKA